MICVIRITGDVGLNKDVKETLNRLRLRRKYACVVLNDSPVTKGMITRVRDFVAFGALDDATLEALITKRAQIIGKAKIDAKIVAKGLKEGKKASDLGIKPFFRLHPPRGGIDAKKHIGVKKGVLGNHKDKIAVLLEKML